MSVIDQLQFINDHWYRKLRVPKFHRDIFAKIKSLLSSREIITLIGPRRVGKTTLLNQTINYLIDEIHVDPHHIIFFSFDLHQDNLINILNAYSTISKIDYRETQLYLVLDEIQYLSNWASHVKFIWDARENIKIIISGSSSSDLLRGKESLAGREFELMVEPLSFLEYQRLTDQHPKFPQMRWELYLKYMDQQLPEIAIRPDSAKQKINMLVDKVINYDLHRLYKISDTQLINSIFRIICKSPGDVIQYHDLARDLNIDPQTVKKYLKYLEDALLIRKLYSYHKNARKSEKAKKRYYPYFTTLHWFAHPHQIEFGKKAETEIAFQLQTEYFWNDRGREIDFIWGKEFNYGIESKMKNRIGPKDIKELLRVDFVLQKYVIHKFNAKIPSIDNVKFVPLHTIQTLKIENTNI